MSWCLWAFQKYSILLRQPAAQNIQRRTINNVQLSGESRRLAGESFAAITCVALGHQRSRQTTAQHTIQLASCTTASFISHFVWLHFIPSLPSISRISALPIPLIKMLFSAEKKSFYPLFLSSPKFLLQLRIVWFLLLKPILFSRNCISVLLSYLAVSITCLFSNI